MFSQLYAPTPDVERYLSRIGFTGSVRLDRDTLDALVHAHLSSVPFENLDIFDLDRSISLGTNALYEKIVAQRRGGYCFELNGLFSSLLSTLGFSCYNVAARVRVGKDYFPPLAHRAIIVRLGAELFFCDVGFGGPMAAVSIPLGAQNEQPTRRSDFRFCASGGEFFLNHVDEQRETPLISFFNQPVDPVDFVALNHYFSTHPDSYFKSRRIAHRLTATGRVSLEGNILRRTGEPPEELDSRSRIAHALDEFFGLSVDETDLQT